MQSTWSSRHIQRIVTNVFIFHTHTLMVEQLEVHDTIVCIHINLCRFFFLLLENTCILSCDDHSVSFQFQTGMHETP